LNIEETNVSPLSLYFQKLTKNKKVLQNEEFISYNTYIKK